MNNYPYPGKKDIFDRAFESVSNKIKRSNKMKEDQLLQTLNTMINSCHAFTIDEFNLFTPQINGLLEKAENQDNTIGLATKDETVGMSCVSMMATATEILCGKRLAFVMDEEGIVDGVVWYEEPVVENYDDEEN